MVTVLNYGIISGHRTHICFDICRNSHMKRKFEAMYAAAYPGGQEPERPAQRRRIEKVEVSVSGAGYSHSTFYQLRMHLQACRSRRDIAGTMQPAFQ